MAMAIPYPSYHASGLPWAPQLPEGWQVQRNGRLFGHRVEIGFPNLPILEVSLRTGVRVRDMDNLKRKQVMSQKEKYKRAAKGDIAYNMMRMWQGAVGPAPVDGLVSPAYVVVKPYPEANSGYFSYLFRTAAYMQEVNKFSRGIVADRNRLYWESFKQMPSLVPPRPEQDQIVAYLRAQDAHIARYIKTKRELIALLTEQKLRIIDHAVTRGLDASVKLKPSGIEWLGEVPEHWNAVRLRQLSTSLQTGPFGSQLHSSDYVDGGIPVINPSHLKDGIIVPDLRCAVDAETSNRLARHRLMPNDIVFARRGELGRCALVSPQEAGWLCGTGSLKARLRPNAINIRFLMFSLSSPLLRGHLCLYSVGSTMDNANTSIIGNIRIPLPPADEQQAICDLIADECQPLNKAIQNTENEITLIREYRDRLIADVVTGQIDVRGWQPGPDDMVNDEDLAALGDDEECEESAEEDDDGAD
jgi:type I restriction enzyme S subunit